MGLASVAFFLSGCDNPACVFSAGGCFSTGGGGAIGASPASRPANGEWIVSAAPKIERFFPNGTGADTRTPIMLVFNESLSPTGLTQAFELGGEGPFSTPITSTALVGDGRVLCLFPTQTLAVDTPFEIRFRQGASIQDRTGQKLVLPANRLVGQFRTATVNTTIPRVIGTYPAGNATSQSATTEIVVVFDRPMLATTVTDPSFVVTVGGVAPVPDPPAHAVLPTGATASDTRVFVYQSADAQGDAASLGAGGASVVVTLSPSGNPIRDVANTNLATTTFDFDLSTFPAPTSAAITSNPSNAIGIAQISGAANLAIEVGLTGAQAGDLLQVFMFGTEPEVAQDPAQIALAREITLDQAATTFTLVASDIDLLRTSSPVAGRFADGEVAFAFQLRRASITSPLRLLDVDPLVRGAQAPKLDTVAPQLLGLSTSGSVTSSFASDLRDLVLVGRASEALFAALVTTNQSEDNLSPGGANPPHVAGASTSGLFVAAAVPVGVLPPGVTRTYTLTIYDKALNAGGSAQGTFRQIGAIALGNPLPDPDISVTVFDATTFAPIAGARVLTHENVLGVVDEVPGGAVTTDSAGHALVPSGTTVGGETILTIDASASGYDLFTIDGLATDEISIPLQPTVLANANAQGAVSSPAEDLDLYTVGVGDTRLPDIGETLAVVDFCTSDPFVPGLNCPYLPFAIRPRRIGAQSAVAVSIPPDVFLYSHLTFLKGFGLALPVAPATAGAIAVSSVEIPFLLEGGGLDPEELPIDVPEQTFDSSGYPFDPSLDTPRVRVEARSAAVPGGVTIGRGVAFAEGPDTWTVRAAYPGSADGIQNVPADDLGRLVTDHTIDADHFLRIEAVDDAGNRGGTRTRFSNLPSSPQVLVPPAPATLTGTFLNFGGVSFNLGVADVLPDSNLMPGLYKVTLTDSNGTGRRWTIYRPDPPDAAGGVVLHIPYIGPNNTLPLTGATVSFRASAYAWEGLDLTNFMWTDIERDCELFSHSTPTDFVPPSF